LSGKEKSDPNTLLSILVALFPSKVLKKSSWFPKSKSSFYAFNGFELVALEPPKALSKSDLAAEISTFLIVAFYWGFTSYFYSA
jgi:hypothetical protein